MMRNTKIWIIAIAVLFNLALIASGREPVFNEATGDFRPNCYNFSYSVFERLPVFPEDFWLKKQLFDSQRIQADRLTSEYFLQPEIMPNWFDWANKTYGDPDRKMIGVYGASLYPSRFTVFDAVEGDRFIVSSLLHTGWGVEIYQGVVLSPVYDENVLVVEQIYPGSNVFLLPPTYPFFNSSWCQQVSFEVTVLVNGSHIVEIYETKPPEDVDSVWSERFKNRYSSGGSILGLRIPKMKIFVQPPNMPGDDIDVVEMKQELSPLLVVAPFAVGAVSVVSIVGYGLWKKHGK